MAPMITAGEWKRVAASAAAILLLSSAPYLFAFASQPPGYVFNGLLLNPVDGNSYFAKMQQGLRGDWLFSLPYTARPGEGVFLFTFYLLLGHLAGWLGLPIVFVFHAARIIGAGFMLLTAYLFVAIFFASPRERLAVWLLTTLGSGFGWLALLAGGFTSDLWVAEAFPFLSAFANPHFPIAAAAEIWIFMAVLQPGGLRFTRRAQVALILAATTALGFLLPFALITVGLVLAVWLVMQSSVFRHQSSVISLLSAVRRLSSVVCCLPSDIVWPHLLFAAAAFPWLLYPYIVSERHPVLSAWSAQNQTPSPPVWDYALSYGLVLALAIVGGVASVVSRRRSPIAGSEQPPRSADAGSHETGGRGGRVGAGVRFLLLWAILNAVLLYVPFPLQRRFTLGLFFPLAILAGKGLAALVPPGSRRYPLAAALLILLAFPSNLVVMLAGLHGVTTRDRALYLTSGEAAAMSWLAAETPQQALVLAAPETGLFIPAWTGRRVVYGHPFETVDAPEKQKLVLNFFGPEICPAKAEALVRSEGVDYLFVGPRELGLEGLLPVSGLQTVYLADGVVIYELPAMFQPTP